MPCPPGRRRPERASRRTRRRRRAELSCVASLILSVATKANAVGEGATASPRRVARRSAVQRRRQDARRNRSAAPSPARTRRPSPPLAWPLRLYRDDGGWHDAACDAPGRDDDRADRDRDRPAPAKARPGTARPPQRRRDLHGESGASDLARALRPHLVRRRRRLRRRAPARHPSATGDGHGPHVRRRGDPRRDPVGRRPRRPAPPRRWSVRQRGQGDLGDGRRSQPGAHRRHPRRRARPARHARRVGGADVHHHRPRRPRGVARLAEHPSPTCSPEWRSPSRAISASAIS